MRTCTHAIQLLGLAFCRLQSGHMLYSTVYSTTNVCCRMAPLKTSAYEERHTRNTPAEVDVCHAPGAAASAKASLGLRWRKAACARELVSAAAERSLAV
jgi:hypothetical protein